MGIKSLVKQVLIEKENRRYRKLLSDKSVSYLEWLQVQEKAGWGLDAEDNVTVDSFVVICASKGSTAKDAAKNIARYFEAHPEVKLLYADEDVCEESGHAPWFKPDWSPDLLDSRFYFGSLVAVSRELFDQCCETWREAGGEEVKRLPFEATDANGLIRRVTDLDSYEKWVHICVDLAGGYQRGSKAIGHFPGILFHSVSMEEQQKFLKTSPFLLQRRREEMESFDRSESYGDRLSVVIPSKDNPEVLRKCIESCLAVTALPLEIVVVDNGSSEENRQIIEKSFNEFRKKTTGEVAREFVYIYQPMEFNFSRMCNMGAECAKGKYLLFLNDDVELCQAGCLEEMIALATREYAGAVGLKLYYPESKRIQHAGITNLPMGPVHKLQFKGDNECYYFGANEGTPNVLAVTAACLIVESAKYAEAGGFSEELRVAFNDVDFCFRLYELGYHNICVNDSYAYHHESLSRGADESFEKLERLLAERDKLYARHPGLEGVDPYYSIYLNREGLDTSIRPGYVTGKNETQASGGIVEHMNLAAYRQDNCLLFRVEDARKGRMMGYGVVLGDNNACYEKRLLFRTWSSPTELQEKSNTDAQKVYGVQLSGQYRPDLEENLSDQVNVALCGYDLRMMSGSIPGGRYQVGMAVRNRVTGLKLVNWSNRVVEL